VHRWDFGGARGRSPVVIAIVLVLLGLAVPHFAGGADWHVGAGRVHGCVGVPPSRCVEASAWAATVPLRDCAGCIPHRTLARLPRDGIVIQLTVARERPLHGTPGPWPVRLRRADVEAGFEGVPARYGVAQLERTSGGVEHVVWVWFGRAHPTAEQLARANEQLQSVR
jgi:hypothetical protein